MSVYCDFSDLPKDQCGHCRTGSATLPAIAGGPAPQKGPWITAKYTGRCSAREAHQIHPGDQIRSDGEGGWLCWRCGDDD
jgi:hypothetical protein